MLRVHKCWICPCAAISEHTAVLAYTNIIGFRWNVPATSISGVTPEWAQNPGTPFGWMRALGSRHTLTSTSGGPAGFAWEKGWWSFGSWTQLFLNWLICRVSIRVEYQWIQYHILYIPCLYIIYNYTCECQCFCRGIQSSDPSILCSGPSALWGKGSFKFICKDWPCSGSIHFGETTGSKAVQQPNNCWFISIAFWICEILDFCDFC